jgi:hypothetical protein
MFKFLGVGLSYARTVSCYAHNVWCKLIIVWLQLSRYIERIKSWSWFLAVNIIALVKQKNIKNNDTVILDMEIWILILNDNEYKYSIVNTII